MSHSLSPVDNYLEQLQKGVSKGDPFSVDQLSSLLTTLSDTASEFNFENSVRIHQQSEKLGTPLSSEDFKRTSEFLKLKTANRLLKLNPSSRPITVLERLPPNEFGVCYKSLSLINLSQTNAKELGLQPKRSIELNAEKVREIASDIAFKFKTSVSFGKKPADIIINPSVSPELQLKSLFRQFSDKVMKTPAEKQMLAHTLQKMVKIKEYDPINITTDLRKNLSKLSLTIKAYDHKLKLKNHLKEKKNYIGTKIVSTAQGDVSIVVTLDKKNNLTGKAIGINGDATGKVVNIAMDLQESQAKVKGSSFSFNAILSKILKQPLESRLRNKSIKSTKDLKAFIAKSMAKQSPNKQSLQQDKSHNIKFQ